MSIVTTSDGAEIFYKDWGSGPAGRAQPRLAAELGQLGGADAVPGRPTASAASPTTGAATAARRQTWDGNEMDTYADDLAALIEALDLRDVTLVGFSTGGGEVARYIGRHGTDRVAKLVLVSAVPPFMLQTDDNPGGVPIEVFDEIRAGSLADRSQLYRDLADGPFFGNNRPGADVSAGHPRRVLAAGHAVRATATRYECIAAFSATDFRGDLAKFDVPTLVIHGDDDQVVPFDVGGQASAALVAGAHAEGLRGRAARHHRHPQGPARRRPARVPQLLDASSAPRFLDQRTDA